MPDAWAGPEVDSVGKNVLRGFGANDKSPSTMSTEQGPQDEGPKPEAPAMEWDKLAKTALDEIGQGYRI